MSSNKDFVCRNLKLKVQFDQLKARGEGEIGWWQDTTHEAI